MSTAMSKEELVELIGNMSVMDVVELVKMMEEKFGVSAAAPVAMAAPAAADAGAVEEEKTEFDVVLTSFGSKKIKVISALRAIKTMNLSLKEAKELVESAPATLREAVSAAEAEEIKAALTAAGAEVEIK